MKYLKTLHSARLLGFFILHSSFCLHAQNTTFTYQGSVQDNGTNYNGAGLFQFALITTNATATNTWWSNDGTSVSGSEPSAVVTVGVTNGLFTVPLGSPVSASMAALPAAVFLQPGLQLKLWFNDGVNSFHAFPLQPLTPAPYATYAATAGIANGLTGMSVQTNADGAPNLIGGSTSNFVASGVVGATISGGGGIDPYAGTSSTNRVTSDLGTVSGGGNNSAGYLSTVGGGYGNSATGYGSSTIAGGYGNYIGGTFDSIGGGRYNTIAIVNFTTFNGDSSTIAGGDDNAIATNSFASVIAGGDGNSIQINSDHSTIGGGNNNVIQVYSPLSTIGGGDGNAIGALGEEGTLTLGGCAGCFISGGTSNIIYGSATDCTIDGGANNVVNYFGYSPTNAFVGGGSDNDAEGDGSFVAGGSQNSAAGGNSFVAGYLNQAGGPASFVAGGIENTAGGSYGFVAGGSGNVAGGTGNAASVMYCFAAGQQAHALNTGAFVWSDSQNAAFSSSLNDSFNIRAQGGIFLDPSTPAINFGQTTKQMLNLYGSSYGIGIQSSTEYFRSASGYAWFKGGVHNNGQNNPGSGGTATMTLDGSGNLECAGTVYSKGLALTSDRNAKENFSPVDNQAVLAKVAALPVTQWNYKTDKAGVQHIGPMAQDFQAAFGLDGPDDKHISVVDEGGVALAAIQGLNQKLQEKDAEIAQLQAKVAQVDALQKQLQELAAVVKTLAGKN